MQKINEKIQRFAESMDFELKANERKGPWEDWGDLNEMFSELEYHKIKLLKAIWDCDIDKIKEHLADCGNFLMFIGNVFGIYNEDKNKELPTNKD